MKHSAQDDPIPDISPGPRLLDRGHLIRDIGIRMADQARRELLLFGPTLDPALYDQPPFLSALRRLALARADLPVRILIFDPRQAYLNGHRLIELAQRLTSRIVIRRVDEDDQDRPDAFLIADASGYVHRRIAATMEAVADFNNPAEAHRLRAIFEQIWERSAADSELRRLFI
jgi:hypothetical protein